uniref:CASP-like protein n=1 Tax=Steinernema glaseri TaxID=37863 RepID=A0A1I8ALW4_9BILA
MEAEMVARLLVKLLQLLVSVYFVFAMYHAGSYWLFMAACLAVPLYGECLKVAADCLFTLGLYLMFRSPDRARHRMPHVMFDAVHRTKNWLRVDATISVTMAAFFSLFAALLFYGYFKMVANRWAYIHGCVAAIVLTTLYLINTALSIRRIQKGKINFAITKEVSTCFKSPKIPF